jgi:hypothetical protein
MTCHQGGQMNRNLNRVALLYLILIKGVAYVVAWRFAAVYRDHAKRKSLSRLGHRRFR